MPWPEDDGAPWELLKLVRQRSYRGPLRLTSTPCRSRSERLAPPFSHSCSKEECQCRHAVLFCLLCPWIDTVAASLPQSGERPCFGKGCIQETYKMHTSLRNTLRGGRPGICMQAAHGAPCLAVQGGPGAVAQACRGVPRTHPHDRRQSGLLHLPALLCLVSAVSIAHLKPWLTWVFAWFRGLCLLPSGEACRSYLSILCCLSTSACQPAVAVCSDEYGVC